MCDVFFPKDSIEFQIYRRFSEPFLFKCCMKKWLNNTLIISEYLYFRQMFNDDKTTE